MKKILLLIPILIVIIAFCLYKTAYRLLVVQPIANELQLIAEEKGLKDVSVKVIRTREKGSTIDYWESTISSSNFDQLSNEEKINIYIALDRSIKDLTPKYYVCGDSTYKIYVHDLYNSDTKYRKIYKNGELIYNYDNSGTSSIEADSSSRSDSASSEPNRELDAWVCAQDIVKANLKSPSSANFCSYPDATITYSGGADYVVVGYVDADNDFGANVRTFFTVTLTLTSQGYKNGYVTFD